MTSYLKSVFEKVFRGTTTVSSALLSMGYSAKERIVNSVLDALEKLGIRKPRGKKAQIRQLEMVQDVIEEKIEELQNGRPNEVLLNDQNGAKKYRIENDNIKDLPKWMDYIEPAIFERVIENIPVKLNVVVKITLQHTKKKDRNGDPITKPFHLEHKAKMIPEENWFKPHYDDIQAILMMKFHRAIVQESGWALQSIDYADITLSSYNPIGGQGYQSLPKWVANRGGIINPKSKEGECFRDAIVIAANLDYFSGIKNPQRITKIHRDLSDEFDFTGIGSYPGTKEYNLFVKNNPTVNLRIYYPDPFIRNWITSCFKTPIIENRPRLVELFLDTTGKGHYSAIKNKSALLSKQMTGKKKRKCHFCGKCDNVFRSEELRDTHQTHCFGLYTRKYRKRNPDTNSPPKMKFKNIKGNSVVQFVCYADSESFLQPTHILRGATSLNQRHTSSSWGYYYEGPFQNKGYSEFFSPTCTKDFVQSLINKCQEIFTEFYEPVVPRSSPFRDRKDVILDPRILKNTKVNYWFKYFPKRKFMTPEVKRIGEEAKHSAIKCYLCGVEFNPTDVKATDHNHFTGEYIGIAHKECNRQRKSEAVMIVFFHHANYDFIQLIPKLCKDYGIETDVGGKPKSGEKFILLTLDLKLAKEVHQTKKGKKSIKDFKFRIKIEDSFSFLNASLEDVMETFPEEDLVNLKKEFPKKSDFDLVRKKMPFPYGYMNDREKFLKPLPKQCECFDQLTGELMDDKTYARLKEIYNHFGCENMGHLQKIYQKVDCVLLSDAMRRKRQTHIADTGLDPANFFTVSHLSFDEFLKTSKAKIDLFPEDQCDFHTLFKNNRRGGFTTAPTRYAKANHKYLENYDKSKPSIFIIPMDVIGMYSSVQEDYLPIGDYEDEEDFSRWREICAEEGVGLFLVVDLEYPLELHDEHNDYPYLPSHLNGRLDANLWDRKEFGLRHESLIDALGGGLVLKKIHKIIKSRDEKFVKDFIDENNRKRRAAKTKFEGDAFKLRNNSAYGKFGQNKDNYSNLKFVQDTETFKNYAGKPEFRKTILLEDNVNVVDLNEMTVMEDRPVSVAQAILDKSKIIMTRYWYGVIKKQYGNKVKFLYGDTDSVYMAIETEDFYEDMIPYVDEWYDTSVYGKNHPCAKIPGFPIGKNHKKAGLMEDDCPDDFITYFWATASKEYCYETEKGKTKIKAKGMGKKTRDKLISWEDFNKAIFGKGQKKEVEQRQIRSYGFENFTIKFNKKIFTGDQKRILLPDKINTLANGHWRDIGCCILPETFPLPKKGTLGRMCLEVLREKYRKQLFG